MKRGGGGEPSAGRPYAGKLKTPVGHASRGLENQVITQEGTSRPSRAGKALCVVMMVVEIHPKAAKKAGNPRRRKVFSTQHNPAGTQPGDS
jgi:hypothetical protein